MKYIKTYEMKKQKPKFSVGDKVVCIFSRWENLKQGEIYEIERITWSRRKGNFVCKLKGVGLDDARYTEYSYFSENNFISELEHDMKNYNL